MATPSLDVITQPRCDWIKIQHVRTRRSYAHDDGSGDLFIVVWTFKTCQQRTTSMTETALSESQLPRECRIIQNLQAQKKGYGGRHGTVQGCDKTTRSSLRREHRRRRGIDQSSALGDSPARRGVVAYATLEHIRAVETH